MNISVTKRDIDTANEHRHAPENFPGALYDCASHCPISLACQRAGIEDPRVGSNTVSWWVRGTHMAARLPEQARDFIWHFDSFIDVEPFDFEMDTP